MKRFFNWLWRNIGLMIVFYFGYFEEVVQLQWVFLFFAWVNSVSCLLLWNEEFKKTFSKGVSGKKRSIPDWVAKLYDFVMLIGIIWVGNFPLAFFWLFANLGQENYWKELRSGKYDEEIENVEIVEVVEVVEVPEKEYRYR